MLVMTPADPLKVLFICLGNTCRSPMAEAIAGKLGGGGIAAYSAGLTPTGRVAEEALSTLISLGYSGESLSSKGLDDVPLMEMDVIVSLLGPDGLIYLPMSLGARLISWSIRDPYGEEEAVFRSVAGILEERIKKLLHELVEDAINEL